MRVRKAYADYDPEPEADLEIMNRRRKMHRISDDVYDNTDAMSFASKRQDQRLLDSITNRLDEIHDSPPIQVKHRQHIGKPPLPPSVVVVRRGGPRVVVAAPAVQTVSLRHRASSVPPNTSAVLDAEVNQYMGRESYAPLTGHRYTPEREPQPRPFYRATSEPPPVGHHVANMAIKQAKQYLTRIESELGVSDNSPYMVDAGPPAYVPSRHTHLHVGNRTPYLDIDDEDLDLPPVSYHHQHRRYVPVSHPTPSRIADIEARLDLHSEELTPPPTSYANLRSRTKECRDRLDVARTLYDRYLPVYLGPEEDDVERSVESKYSQLASRIPQLDPYRPHTSADVSSIPVYRPTPRSTGSHIDSGKSSAIPPVSDTRARIREVLCKTKKDPYYFQ